MTKLSETGTASKKHPAQPSAFIVAVPPPRTRQRMKLAACVRRPFLASTRTHHVVLTFRSHIHLTSIDFSPVLSANSASAVRSLIQRNPDPTAHQRAVVGIEASSRTETQPRDCRIEKMGDYAAGK